MLGPVGDSDTDLTPMARSILQPLPLLLQTFRPFLPDQNESFWLQLVPPCVDLPIYKRLNFAHLLNASVPRIAPYFLRVEFKREMPIWRIGANADW